MADQNKDIEYYLGLEYDLKIAKIEDEGDSIYKAYAKELDPAAFYGVGKTREEAIASFEHVRKQLLPYYLEKGLHIPEPVREDLELPSGRFLLRVSPVVHKQLAEQAEQIGRSLNAYVESVLAQYCCGASVLNLAAKRLDAMVARCEKNLQYRWLQAAWDTSDHMTIDYSRRTVLKAG